MLLFDSVVASRRLYELALNKSSSFVAVSGGWELVVCRLACRLGRGYLVSLPLAGIVVVVVLVNARLFL